MGDWYYVAGGAQAGPIDEAAFRKMFEAGTLPRTTLVWKAGMENWQAAVEIAAFAPALTLPYVITPVVPREWKPKASLAPKPPDPPEKKGWFRRSPQAAVPPPPPSRPKPAPPAAFTGVAPLPPYAVRYQMGFRHVLCLVACLFLAAFAMGHVHSGKSYVLKGVVPLSPQGATVFFEFLAAACMLGAGMMALGLLVSLFPPWRLRMTGDEIIIPRVFFFGSHRIPYNSIQSITERAHRGRLIGLRLRTSRGNYTISRLMLPSQGDYDFIKRSLAGKGGASAPGLAPWLRPRIDAPPATRSGGVGGYLGRRFSRLCAVGGILFFLLGGNYALTGLQTGAVPTEIPITEFERNPPANRNVVITGSYLDVPHSVKFILRHGPTDPHPEVAFFVPLADGPGHRARVVLKITAFLLDRDKNIINSNRLHVIRVNQAEFDTAVRDRMRQAFGDDVNDMIVVEYGNRPGFYVGLSLVAVGVVLFLIRNLFTR